jgi:hypothetical protein
MLDGLVPDEHVGHLKRRPTITLADLSRLTDVRFAMFDRVVVLAGQRPFSRLTLNSHGLARNEARQKVWSDVATQFATECRAQAGTARFSPNRRVQVS